MGTLNKIIQPLGGFQYSVNIYYDINDENKIKSYVPSSSSLRIIEDILMSTENSSVDRARILTGAYGKGKSHLVLAITSLLAGNKEELFSNIMNKAQQINGDLYLNLQRFFKSGKKLLPVIVNADSLNMKTVLLQSLSDALKRVNLSSFMPTTFYDAAVEKILSWKDAFPDTYLLLEKMLGQSVDVFVEDLRRFNPATYQRFVKIYPKLTSGSEFNPLFGTNIVSIYESAAKELKKVGYNGIFVVYDEFGKYLEGVADKSASMDTKLLQDFVEACTRSQSEQLHILLVSHKNIDNYLGGLSKKSVDSWRAISNRFKPITIDNDDAELYDMVASVLCRDKKRFAEYVEANRIYFDKMHQTFSSDRAFEKIRNLKGENLVEACYPLHPYSLLLLPKISELVAQNERTIFTFLSSTERYTVPYYIRQNVSEFPLIEPDYIYDYFEKLLKNEPYGSSIKKQWQIADGALSKIKDAENELAEKIIKTIALIYCVNEFEVVPPSWDVIEEIYSINHRPTEINAAKEVLKVNNVLIELLFKPYVRLAEGSGHNVLDMIKQEVYRSKSDVKAERVLANISSTKYFYPAEYNDENEIVRYFDLRFISVNELLAINEDIIAADQSDGIVYAVYVKDEYELDKAITHVISVHNPRGVFIVPNMPINMDERCMEYAAIEKLIQQYKGQEVALTDELSFIAEDRNKVISKFVEQTYLFPEANLSVYYNAGKEVSLKRRSQFSKLLSEIMDGVYYNTPKIINDLINKNNISGSIRNARQKIIAGLLAGSYNKNLGIVGFGPEINILNAVLVEPGIFINEEVARLTTVNLKDEKVEKLLAFIKEFMLKATSSPKSLGELYKQLTGAEFGYGLKKGVVAIYLVVVIEAYFRGHVVITKKGREIPLNPVLFNEIDNAPDLYSIFIESWDESKDAYISGLEEVFYQYINNDDKVGGSFVYVVKAMRRWYLQLSRFEIITKKCCDENGNVSQLDKATLKFRNLLNSPEVNSHELLFEELFKCFNTDNPTVVINSVRLVHKQLGNNLFNFKRRIVAEIKKVFRVSENISMTSAFANYYDDLSRRTKEHSFSGKNGAFLNIAQNPNNNEMKLVEDLARAICNLRIGDFTDDIMEGFVEDIKSTKQEIDAYNSRIENENGANGGYKISFVDSDGQEIVRQFDSADISTPQSQYLRNNILSDFEEFGDSLSVEEKRQILFNILKDLN